MHFEWQTEEDRPPNWPPREEEQTAHGRKWVRVLLACLLLLPVGYGFWRQVRGGVAVAEQSVAESIRGVHRLAERAAAQADGELLVSLLSGREPAWTAAQRQRLNRGLLFSQAAQPFAMHPTGESAVDDVSLDPELLEASLSVEQAYVVTQTTGVTERVTLRQTHVYRKGEQRWLLSPPAEEFWGETKRRRGPRVTVSYPERDEAIAARLAEEIDRKVGEMCATLSELDCPAGFRLDVHLSPAPDSFLALERSPSPATELTLPTPSLVGLPAGENAYQALFRGYAARVAAAGITALVEYECCRRVLFFQAALDWQLYHLGLQPRPLTARRYVAAIDSLAGPAWFQMLWYREALAERPPAERALALATVELLTDGESEGTSAAMLQRTLPAGGIPNDWLQEVSSYPSLAAFYQALQAHLMARANETQAFPPLPEQELLLTCYADGQAHLYRFAPATEQLSEAGTGREDMAHALPFPGDEAKPSSSLLEGGPSLLWQGAQDAEARLRAERQYVFRPDIFSQVYSTLDAQGRYIAMQLMAYGPQRISIPIAAEQCDEQCPEWQRSSANPAWSPDGDALLWQQDGHVWRGDQDSGRPVGRGSFPFWVDAATYGYLSGERVVIAQTDDDVAHTLLTIEELLDVVRQSEADDHRGRLTAIQADPGGSGAIVFFTTLGPGKNYLLLLPRHEVGPSWFERRPQPADLSVLFHTQAGIDSPPSSSFSPLGKWFVATTGFSGDGPPGRSVFDLRHSLDGTGEPQMVTFAPGRYQINYDWSAGDGWLAWPRQNYVELLSPASGAVRYFVSGPPDRPPWQWCESVAWVTP